MRQRVRVPSQLIGRCLDHRHASHAIRLLVIRAYEIERRKRRGDTGPYSLNERNVEIHYGVTRHSFQRGMRLLLERQVLERTQNGGRTFAVERLVAHDEERYVLLPVGLRGEPDVLALLAVIELTPKPLILIDAAKRIHVKSPKTRATLLSRLIEEEFVLSRLGLHGRHEVVRTRTGFAEANGQSGKIQPGKNHPAQESREESQIIGRYYTSPTEVEYARPRDRRALRDRLALVDRGKVLATQLMSNTGIGKLLVIVAGDDELIDAIVSRVADLNLSGAPPGKVRAWSYFAGVIDDHNHAKAEALMIQGGVENGISILAPNENEEFA